MVGGLVQQQNVRLFQQKPGKIDPGLFAAGQAVEFLGPLGSCDAQTVADLVHIHVHLVAAAGLEAVHQGIVFPELLGRGPLGHGLFQGLHLPLGFRQVRKGRAQHILHRVARGEFGYLGDQAQLFIGIHIDLAPVIVHFPGENLQECGLSAAVSAQDCDTLSLLDFKGQTIQEVFSDYKEFYKVFYRYINHCLSPKLLRTMYCHYH